MDFKATNNEAEYKAVLARLAIDWEARASSVKIKRDSQVVAGQIEAKGDRMKRYMKKVNESRNHFSTIMIEKILRELVATSEFLYSLVEPAIKKANEVGQIEESPKWAKNIISFLSLGTLPEDKKQAQRTKMQSARYTIIGGTLYKKAYTLPLLKYVSKQEA